MKPLDVEKSETAKQTQKNEVRLIQIIRFLTQYIAELPVKVDGNKGTLLLKPNPGLVDLLCIEDSVLETNQKSRAMVVVSNNSKISHVLKSGEEIWTVCKVSVVNSVNMNVNSHLHTMSFIGLGYAEENPTNPVPGEDNSSLNVVSANLPNELILAEDNEILTIDVEEE